MYKFFSVTLRNYRTVGTVWPSSRALSKALAKNVMTASGPKRVLEVGPGTGPVTRYILGSLKRGDHFDLVELNPEFCKILRERVIGPWKAAHPGIAVTLHECPIEDAPLRDGSYDHIVSGLPFNNFPADLVKRIMNRFEALLKPNGSLAYFGYKGIRPVKAVFIGTEGRRNLNEITRIENEMLNRHGGHRQLVMANVPPASVQRMRKTAAR